MFNKKTFRRCAAFAAAMLFVIVTVLALPGCSKLNKDEKSLNKEENALLAAVKEVCPKDNNHSKAKYLAFAIEGWSFAEMPTFVVTYLQEYCKQGNAAYMPESFEKLIEKGYIAETEGDDFYSDYGEHEKVFMSGEGKLFTFILKEGDPANSDRCVVTVKGYISDHDCHWFDLEMEYRSGGWQCVKKSDVGNNLENTTNDPNETREPIK